jgi:hypothetical protein
MGSRCLQDLPALGRRQPAPEVEGGEGDPERARGAKARHLLVCSHTARAAALGGRQPPSGVTGEESPRQNFASCTVPSPAISALATGTGASTGGVDPAVLLVGSGAGSGDAVGTGAGAGAGVGVGAGAGLGAGVGSGAGVGFGFGAACAGSTGFGVTRAGVGAAGLEGAEVTTLAAWAAGWRAKTGASAGGLRVGRCAGSCTRAGAGTRMTVPSRAGADVPPKRWAKRVGEGASSSRTIVGSANAPPAPPMTSATASARAKLSLMLHSPRAERQFPGDLSADVSGN